MIGIMANSDGRVDAVQTASNLFLASGVEFAIHLGDIGGRHVLDAMAPLGGFFVWGDRDHDRTGLMRYGNSLGLQCFGIMGEFEHAEKKIMMLHGDDRTILKKLIAEQQYDYVLCGHGLGVEDEMVGKTRILNPGPLHGDAKSAMMLEVASGKVKIVPL
jgi:predicted phosphodiesterase